MEYSEHFVSRACPRVAWVGEMVEEKGERGGALMIT